MFPQCKVVQQYIHYVVENGIAVTNSATISQ